MEQIGDFFVDTTMKCWACGVFDNLFAIISDSAALMYNQLAIFGVVIFCILFSFYIVNAVWENIKGKSSDKMFQDSLDTKSLLNKSIKPVLIKSMIALALLGMGLQVPKLISKITFEPVATVTLEFSKVIIPNDYPMVQDYQKIQLSEDGFFSPKLRDTILALIQTSITNFQVYVKIGLGIIESAFSINKLVWISSLVKHLIVFFIGLLLTYTFVRLFIKYSFCFMDIILAMALFAFFFPLSLVFFIFKDASGAPGWMKKMGGDLGSGQIKSLINAIASVAATILTYTIIMVVISGYFKGHGVDITAFENSIDTFFDFDLENSDAMQLTFAGTIVLVYVIRYISDQVKPVTKKIFETFNININTTESEKMGDNMLKLTSIIANEAKKIATTIVNPDKAKSDSGDKKEEPKK